MTTKAPKSYPKETTTVKYEPVTTTVKPEEPSTEENPYEQPASYYFRFY